MKTHQQSKSSAFRGAALLAFCIFMFALIFRSYIDYSHSKERGRFVLSILKQDRKELTLAHYLAGDFPQATDNLPQLQVWLVKQLLTKSPIQTRQVTARLMEFKTAKPEMEVSLHRWRTGLLHWTNSENRSPARTQEDTLKDGRLLYYEATGYLKIGRELDATVLYLRSFDLLSRYIESSPTSPDVPEALFLTGVSKLRLSKALPIGVRGNRLLNLCVELYPDSIWARLSRESAREGSAEIPNAG